MFKKLIISLQIYEYPSKEVYTSEWKNSFFTQRAQINLDKIKDQALLEYFSQRM